MKKLTFGLAAILLLSTSISIIAQEKNEQLWYCWEETVKPEMIDKYLELSKEFLNLYKSEKFPFAIFTWQAQPFTYELWTPINSLADIEKISEASRKIVEKLGKEKYAEFNSTKMCNREYMCTMKNDMIYTPDNPDLTINEIGYELAIELYIKPGKQKEFEEAVKAFNAERAKKDYGSIVFYAAGGFGYEQPCYIAMIADKSEADFLESQKRINEVMEKERREYMNIIRPLMRKPSINHDWFLLRDLSYEPGIN